MKYGASWTPSMVPINSPAIFSAVQRGWVWCDYLRKVCTMPGPERLFKVSAGRATDWQIPASRAQTWAPKPGELPPWAASKNSAVAKRSPPAWDGGAGAGRALLFHRCATTLSGLFVITIRSTSLLPRFHADTRRLSPIRGWLASACSELSLHANMDVSYEAGERLNQCFRRAKESRSIAVLAYRKRHRSANTEHSPKPPVKGRRRCEDAGEIFQHCPCNVEIRVKGRPVPGGFPHPHGDPQVIWDHRG